MAKKPKDPKLSWSKRYTQLPHGKRILERVSNEITRLENTVREVKLWPDDEHNIGELKTQLNSSLAWLRNAKATAEAIPESFRPNPRRSRRKFEEGNIVSINSRFVDDYGLTGKETFEIESFIGRRVRISNEDLTILALKGHLVFKGETQ